MEFVNYRTDYLFIGVAIDKLNMNKKTLVAKITPSFISFLGDINRKIRDFDVDCPTSTIEFPLYTNGRIIGIDYDMIERINYPYNILFVRLSSDEEDGLLFDCYNNFLRFNRNFEYVIDYVEYGANREETVSTCGNGITISSVINFLDSNPIYRAKEPWHREWVKGIIRKLEGKEYITDNVGVDHEIIQSTKCRSTNVFDSNGNMIFEDDITDRGRVYLDQPGNFPYVVENVGGEEKKVYICGETSLKVIGNIYNQKN